MPIVGPVHGHQFHYLRFGKLGVGTAICLLEPLGCQDGRSLVNSAASHEAVNMGEPIANLSFGTSATLRTI